jgi:hypothetical protein
MPFRPMKLSPVILIAFALAGVCAAVPPGATTSVPAFLDVNGDGTISEGERQAYQESRANARAGGAQDWDSNGDGTVDEAERQGAVAELTRRMDAKVASLFLDLAGEDALLSLAEFSSLPKFANTPPEVPANLFGKLDADANGSVTLAEFFKGTGRGNPPAGAAARKKGKK